MKRARLRRMLPGLAVVVFAFFFLRTTTCTGPPEVVGPDSSRQGAVTEFRIFAWGVNANIDLTVDWGDGIGDTLRDISEEAIEAAHIWTDIGKYRVRAMWMYTHDNQVYSDWSPPHEIEILPNDVPTADFDSPAQAPVDVETRFTAWGTEPDGEDVSLMMRFGDEESEWSEYVRSGKPVTITHVFTDIGETLWVSARARDVHGAPGPWSDSVFVVTTDAGRMLWGWGAGAESLFTSAVTSPVVAWQGNREVVYFGARDEYNRIYGLDVATGSELHHGNGILPEDGYTWTSHPVYNQNTGHILAARSEGLVYAFRGDLTEHWRWPRYMPGAD